ncbi:MAG: 3-carboxy-cis,cis-muconate cycloisomerase, partial [Brevibacterium sp.]|nr:3-carboxy-cis,cis-muconate cycloisomerase [Brevibacterium sp.]
VEAASPGIFAERLTITFGDRLTKTEIKEIIAAGGQAASALKSALDKHPANGDDSADDDIEGFFSPENYLGDAEDIRQTIIATINGPEPVAPGLLPFASRK